MSRLEQPEAGSSPLHFANQYPQPLWRQTLIILVKNLVRRLSGAQQFAFAVKQALKALPSCRCRFSDDPVGVASYPECLQRAWRDMAGSCMLDFAHLGWFRTHTSPIQPESTYAGGVLAVPDVQRCALQLHGLLRLCAGHHLLAHRPGQVRPQISAPLRSGRCARGALLLGPISTGRLRVAAPSAGPLPPPGGAPSCGYPSAHSVL